MIRHVTCVPTERSPYCCLVRTRTLNRGYHPLHTERSHSGLVRALGKRVNLKGFRGFESPPLRHVKILDTKYEIPDTSYAIFPSLSLFASVLK